MNLDDRMKMYYEKRAQSFLPRRTFSIIRIDGKAFHTFTKNLQKPFDSDLVESMNYTALELCKKIQGVKLAYVQSDEISLLVTDFDTLTSDSWFNGNIQKITSVSASIATKAFFTSWLYRYFSDDSDNFKKTNTIKDHFSGIKNYDWQDHKICVTSIPSYFPNFNNFAEFDSRVFTIPSKTEVINYFIWRQKDAIRNSISSVAQSNYSHKELLKKNTSEMVKMLNEKGVIWDQFDLGLKNGRIILKETIEINSSLRSKWVCKGANNFISDKDELVNLIPNNE